MKDNKSKTQDPSLKALTKVELEELAAWMSHHPGDLPESVAGLLMRMIAVYSDLTSRGDVRAKQTLHQLRMAMGIVPKSEKGSQILGQGTSEKHGLGTH
jgi:hypothetical protein